MDAHRWMHLGGCTQVDAHRWAHRWMHTGGCTQVGTQVDARPQQRNSCSWAGALGSHARSASFFPTFLLGLGAEQQAGRWRA